MRGKGRICIFLGAVFLIAAAGLAAWNTLADRAAEKSANHTAQVLLDREEAQAQPENQNVDTFPGSSVLPDNPGEELIPDYILDPQREMPTVEIDGWEYIGLLEIPSLSLSLPIMAQWSYDGLRIAPGRYAGSLYTNDLVISGHNYTSHFGSLKELKQGDQVFITDMDGNIFAYQVLGTEILQPNDVEDMIHGEWDLTMFTCTVGGLQRISVRCQLSAGEPSCT